MNLFDLTPVGSINQKARKLINNVFPDLLYKIDYNVSSSLETALQLSNIEEEADGAYDNKTKTVYLHKNSQIETALHEIGHSAHYQLFNIKDFNFSTINKSDRAYLNHKEDFAEAFKDCVINVNNKSSLSERDVQMIRILN